jgi:hypothetical protein
MPLYSIALAGNIIIVAGLPVILTANGTGAPKLTLVGVIGLYLTLVMLNITEGSVEGYIKPYLARHRGIPANAPAGLSQFEMVALLCLAVGLTCLGLALIRGRVLSWWVGALFIAPVVTGIAGLPGALALTSDYLAFAAMFTIGVKTLCSIGRPAGQESRVPAIT